MITSLSNNRELNISELPKEIENILVKYNAPEKLKRHLRLVSFTADNLIFYIQREWINLYLNEELIKFGAATHDIGKVIEVKELYQSGKKHEAIGQNLLIENGFSQAYSRFAYTHGNWKNENLKLEDLIVSLADKIWKGKRVFELEEMIAKRISNELNVDYWNVYQVLDTILQEIEISAQKRLNWQNKTD